MCKTETDRRASTSRFVSKIPYSPERIHAAAVYCSDGRVGDQFDDFLHNELDLPRYDRLALPGGPASLAGHAAAFLKEQGVVEELRFLVEAHELDRIVLIAHQGCAFYASRLQLPEPFLEQQQHIDLLRARQFVQQTIGVSQVETYFARRVDEQTIHFEEVVIP